MEKLNTNRRLSWEEAREVVRKDLEGRGYAHLEAARLHLEMIELRYKEFEDKLLREEAYYSHYARRILEVLDGQSSGFPRSRLKDFRDIIKDTMEPEAFKEFDRAFLEATRGLGLMALAQVAATTEPPAEDYLKTLEDVVVLQMNAEAASQVLVILQIMKEMENTNETNNNN